MTVKLRLMRMGKKKQPTYRIVVADSRSPRDGRFIETVGTYAPRIEPSTIEIDNAKAVSWLAKGAQPTDRVARLLDSLGVLKHEQSNNPKKALPKKKAQERAAAAEKAAATPA